ncbi:exo-alpha-sialidase [Pseudomonas sp. PDNC002]|uniref:sialidase family protein n=1 Tax=Pseudomonas sp. PDNC002 TaxID=2811422 RepID=UPI0019662635|nr:sialidase family protein [Pseudomonas sp. PDNC002]QRY77168.1 exo-alpha-sialidase [Pseudomonas sp. PDNC002]
MISPIRSVVALLVVAIFGFAWYQSPSFEVSDFAPGAVSPAPGAAPASLTRRFASSDMRDFVHSASLATLPNGALMATWFAGSREGAADVQIRAATFDPISRQWSDERVLATRLGTEQAVRKNIRKLGNPVVALSPDNRLWLFYVSVSVGGWAGSAINAMYSDDLGKHWSTPRQLVTTPFLNLSTLVRGAPVFHRDGSIGLPVYHEFMGKFAEYLYLGPEGDVRDKFRISKGKHSLQPTVVAQDGRRAVALLRYAGERHHRVLASHTLDAGQSWSAPVPVEPSNPNSSLAAVGRANGNLLVAMNDLEDGRFRLTLYETDAQLRDWRLIEQLDESPDPWGDPVAPEVFRALIGKAWQNVDAQQPGSLEQTFLASVSQRMCESGQCRFEYEYPYFARDAAGAYHLVYSWNDTFIKHVSFSDAWVEEKR